MRIDKLDLSCKKDVEILIKEYWKIHKLNNEFLKSAKMVIFPNGGRNYINGKEALFKAIEKAEKRK